MGTMGKAVGAGGSDEPGAPAAARASASHLKCSGLGTLGVVGPTGLPKIQLMPITTGRKKRSMQLNRGAIRMEITPAPITEPKISPAPAVPPVLCAIEIMGATEAKVTPIITGS